ncbi:hypothetical protein AOA80_07585 [Methanomassiliicoccales archaeon RumEn M1]|jgi:hypothetical protein|nr:hypothetical protein AOA80_07585 [Methanomassiliicoccales archaeon RumEn M1]
MNSNVKNDTRITLLIEGYPRTGYQTYARLIGGSSGGLCIGRLHPEYVAQKYGLQRAKRYWLSSQKEAGTISPKALGTLVKLLRSELKGRSGGKVMLDGLEYLLLFHDIGKVMGSLEEIDGLLKQADVTMLVLIDPHTLEPKDMERLWEAYPQLTSEELLDHEGAAQGLSMSTMIGQECANP